MEFRRSRPDDAPGIRALELEYFSDAWGERDIFSAICTEGAMCYSAVDEDGSIVAYVLGRIIAPEGEIYRIAVDEHHRRRGIGYRLLSFALKTERGRGLESTFLEVRSKNEAAIALYRAYGFEDIGIRKNYYKNPTDDAIVMVLGK